MPRARFVTALSLLALFLPALVSAQSGSPGKPPPGPPVAKLPASARLGTLVGINTDEMRLQLKERSGKVTAYDVVDTTRYMREKKAAEPTAFRPGETVVIRLRKVRGKDQYFTFECCDVPSWNWLSDLRRKTTQGLIRAHENDTLTVAVLPDDVLLTYTVSAKTRWIKGGQPSEAEAFGPEQQVWVVPRQLPSGGIMAQVVADSEAAAERGRESGARSVQGTLQSVDLKAGLLGLTTAAGQNWNVLVAATTEARFKGKPAPLTILRPAMKVRVSLKRDAKGDAVARIVTVEAGASGPKKSAAAPPKSGARPKP